MSLNPGFVIGFDLDQTLYDTGPAIAATMRAVAAQQGIDFDVAAATAELGPPLEELVSRQLGPETTARFVAGYRAIYHDYLGFARLLPGARESLAAVSDAGGQSIVITGKNTVDATRHARHDALDVSHVIGWSWAETKTAVMREHAALAYVGDHPADVTAARAAGAQALAVTTGTHDWDDLTEADEIFISLTEFPGWLKDFRSRSRRAGSSEPIDPDTDGVNP